MHVVTSVILELYKYPLASHRVWEKRLLQIPFQVAKISIAVVFCMTKDHKTNWTFLYRFVHVSQQRYNRYVTYYQKLEFNLFVYTSQLQFSAVKRLICSQCVEKCAFFLSKTRQLWSEILMLLFKLNNISLLADERNVVVVFYLILRTTKRFWSNRLQISTSMRSIVWGIKSAQNRQGRFKFSWYS